MTTTLLKYIIFSLTMALFYSAVPQQVTAAPNLIVNATFESLDPLNGARPDKWESGFGTTANATSYIYPVAGFNSSKAARTEIDNTRYTAGDSKWLFTDVPVLPGQQYIYSDMYRANVKSEVLVRFNKGVCPSQESDCAYTNILGNSAVNNWTAAQAQFVVPDGVRSVSIFRRIQGSASSSEARLWLEIDEVSLELESGVVITDQVPNYSLEQAIGGGALPRGWQIGGYGQNATNFEYIKNDGHHGSRSVKVNVSNYISGDAKWMYAPQPVIPGGDYRFSAWYKTNTEPHVVAQYTDRDGRISFLGMPQPEPQKNQDWQFYENEFSVPSDVVSVTVFFYLSSNGWVQTDEYRITPYKYSGFKEPMVTLTFDDGAEENTLTALPELNRLGLKSTHCYTTGAIEGTPDQVKQINRVLEFYSTGHEICAHSVTHPDLTTLSPAALDFELKHSREYLESIVKVPVPNFVSPFGSYNENVVNATKKHFASHRSVDEGYNSIDNLDLYRLKVQNMGARTTLTEFKEWVNKAKADKLWLILVYHKVTNGQPDQFDTATQDFKNQMEWLAGSGVKVKRLDQALASIVPATDSVPPVIAITPYDTTPTNKSVTVFATTNEGVLNNEAHTFISNGSFTFVATDGAGNKATITVTINHIDTVKPVITLIGVNPMGGSVNTPYTELGAVANDNVSGTLTSKISINTSALDITKTGTYQVLYSVNDAAGNVATTSRTIVIAPRAITLKAVASSKAFGTADPSLQYRLVNGTLIGSDTVTGILARDAGETIGVYAIKIGTISAGNSYAINFEGDNFTITPPVCMKDETLVGTACERVVVADNRGKGGGGSKKSSSYSPKKVRKSVATTTFPGTVLGTSTVEAYTEVPLKLLTRNLKLGLRGTDVTQLQELLALKGMYVGPITGFFGPMTGAAVKIYQQQIGVPATGLVGDLTRKHLEEELVTKEKSIIQLIKKIAVLQNKLKQLQVTSVN